MFWSLRLSDVSVPIEQFEKSIKEADEANAKLLTQELKDCQSRHSLVQKKCEEEFKTWFQSCVFPLPPCCELHLLFTSPHLPSDHRQMPSGNFVNFLFFLFGRSDFLFIANRASNLNALLEQCILPRLKVSSTDAIFCAKFIALLHATTPTETFSFVVYLQRYLSLTFPFILTTKLLFPGLLPLQTHTKKRSLQRNEASNGDRLFWCFTCF